MVGEVLLAAWSVKGMRTHQGGRGEADDGLEERCWKQVAMVTIITR